MPHCPTFQLTSQEADSPRGRITLIKGFAEGGLPASPVLAEHLHTCLHCGQCEAVCPLAVPFESIINKAKRMLAEKKPSLMQPLPWWLSRLSLSALWQKALAACLWMLRTMGLLRLLPRLRPFVPANWLMPLAAVPATLFTPPRPSSPPARRSATRPQAALFTGCMAPALDDNAVRASRFMLRSIGYEVRLPRTQTCCAALYEHAGNTAVVKELLAKNRLAFAPFDEVISCASGCGASLLRHQKELDFAPQEIHSFLLRHARRLKFLPLKKRAYLHTPCSIRGSLSLAVEELLARVPGLSIQRLTTTACCGAAGVNMLNKPEAAAALAKPIVNELAAGKAELALTSNLGCALHLRQQLFCRSLRAEIMHPVELLARQLQF